MTVVSKAWMVAFPALALAGCLQPAAQAPMAPVVALPAPTMTGPVPAPTAPSTSARRIAANAAGGLTLPDGTDVDVNPDGGFTLPNGAVVRRNAAGGLVLPNGAVCAPDADGYLCP